jgi:uncharacterized protein YukE
MDANEADPAEKAFQDLAAEVAVLRRTVDALPDAWKAAAPPDYTPTLAAVRQQLGAVADALAQLQKHPAFTSTPAQYRQAMVDAGASTVETFAREARQQQQAFGTLIASARERREQNRWLWIVGISALVVGWLSLPMLIAQLPKAANAWVLRLSTRDAWAAGAQLMADANPERWSAAQLGYRLVLHPENRAAIAACLSTAHQTRRGQRCSLVVPAESSEPLSPREVAR